MNALKRVGASTEDPQRSNEEEQILADPDRHASTLLQFSLGDETVGRLRAIAWNDVGKAVYEELWHGFTNHNAKWFGSWTPERLPIGQAAFIRIGSDLVRRTEINVNSDERVGRAVFVLTAGLGSLLARNGWSIEKAPGRPRSRQGWQAIQSSRSGGAAEYGVDHARGLEARMRGARHLRTADCPPVGAVLIAVGESGARSSRPAGGPARRDG